jgi:DNA-binding NarL/FixJ family response regulator
LTQVINGSTPVKGPSTAGAVRPRILIADDHRLVVAGLSKLLEKDFDIVAVASNGRELLELAEQYRPDAILLDISMPMLNGIEATRQICRTVPKTKIIVLTQQTGKEYVQAALQAGARGYVVKQSAPTELLAALREVLAGRFYITRLVIPKDIASLLDNGSNPLVWFASQLTPRQREVLQLVGEGKSGKEIADILQISVMTVEFHKTKLMDQLGLHTTAELTRYAIEHGII